MLCAQLLTLPRFLSSFFYIVHYNIIFFFIFLVHCCVPSFHNDTSCLGCWLTFLIWCCTQKMKTHSNNVEYQQHYQKKNNFFLNFYSLQKKVDEDVVVDVFFLSYLKHLHIFWSRPAQFPFICLFYLLERLLI